MSNFASSNSNKAQLMITHNTLTAAFLKKPLHDVDIFGDTHSAITMPKKTEIWLSIRWDLRPIEI